MRGKMCDSCYLYNWPAWFDIYSCTTIHFGGMLASLSNHLVFAHGQQLPVLNHRSPIYNDGIDVSPRRGIDQRGDGVRRRSGMQLIKVQHDQVSLLANFE